MGKTSSAVKDRWNKKNYDTVLVRIPKGRKADLEEHTHAHGKTVNGLINALIRAELGLTEDEWKKKG